jgi:nucleoside-diphosphate-sugar epimerase
VEACLLAAAHDDSCGHIFNLGGEPVISLEKLAHLLVDIYGRGEFIVRPYPEDRKPIDVGDYYADFGKISECLGWRPGVTLRDGLQRSLGFYEEHLSHYV